MTPEDEAYAAQLLQKMKAQNAAFGNAESGGNPDQSPGGPIMGNPKGPAGGAPLDLKHQAALNEIQTAPMAAPAQGAFAECPQCGTMHPPLAGGKTCPNRKVEIPDAGITDDQISGYIGNFKNIIVSQIEKKGIKNGNKLFQQLTLNITKFLEDYTE